MPKKTDHESHMKSCPNCRTKFDPTFTMFCPDCGTSVDPSVGSMNVPKPEILDDEQPVQQPRVAVERPQAGPAVEALRRSGPGFGGRLLRGVGIRVIIAVVVLGIGAIAGALDDGASGGSTDVTLDEVGAVDFSLGDQVGASSLAIGDCVNWPSDDGDTFETLERLDCALPHDAEVFALVDHPAEPGLEYPGNDTVADWGVQACYEAFEPYVGATYEDAADLDYTFFTPTELGWRKYDDRAIQCLIYKVDETSLLSSVRTGA